jgi:glycosyltransferase involved in cell wall biosynthesis
MSENKKLKILVFCDYYLPINNGIVQYINNLYSNLALIADVEFEVVTFNDKGYKDFEVINGIKIHRIDCYRILGGTYSIPKLNSYLKIFKNLKLGRFTHVNTHTRFFISSLLGLRFSSICKIPLIHTEHGSGFVPHSNFIVKLIARVYDETFGRLLISCADVVCPVSNFGSKFCKSLGAKNINIIENGISSDFNLVKVPHISDDVFSICFVGRVVKEKGLCELIEACSKLDFKYKLHIIGDGIYLSDLKVLCSDLKIDVEFYGFKNRDYVMSFLKNVNVFVNPSYAEGFPTSVLEASISGCQVIATDVGGTREIIGGFDGTYLIELDNLLDSIILACFNRDSIDLSELREYVLGNFEWKLLSNNFYFKVLKK